MRGGHCGKNRTDAAVQTANYNLMQKEPEYRAVLRFGLIREYRKRVRFYFEVAENRRKKKCRK